MFVCANCLQEFDDASLEYAILPESRLVHPAKFYFERRFHSLGCLEAELDRMIPSWGPLVLFKCKGDEREQLSPHPMRAGELLDWVRTNLTVAR